MAGVNLSQSMTEDNAPVKKESFFSGASVSVMLLVLSLAGWGGLRFYLDSLDKQIAAIDATLSSNHGKLQGENVNRVVDFAARVGFFQADPAELVDPQDILTKTEALIVPAVTLIEYAYNQGEKMITLSGKTDNYKHLAEQILSLKSESLLSRVKVDAITRDKEGIHFILKASLVTTK